MTLRDQIAIAAMQGILANGLTRPDAIPFLAYTYADAMLEQRKKSNPKKK